MIQLAAKLLDIRRAADRLGKRRCIILRTSLSGWRLLGQLKLGRLERDGKNEIVVCWRSSYDREVLKRSV